MQLCRTIHYSIVPWLLNMFRAIISLETCWAVKEPRNNKLCYTVASFWSYLLDLYYDARIHERQAAPDVSSDRLHYATEYTVHLQF